MLCRLIFCWFFFFKVVSTPTVMSRCRFSDRNKKSLAAKAKRSGRGRAPCVVCIFAEVALTAAKMMEQFCPSPFVFYCCQINIKRSSEDVFDLIGYASRRETGGWQLRSTRFPLVIDVFFFLLHSCLFFFFEGGVCILLHTTAC